MRTIDHIAAKGQASERVVHHIMYGAKVLVAADERRALLVARVNQHAGNVREGRLAVQTFYLDVSISVVVELVLECLIALAACDVMVGEDAFVKITAECQHVAIADGDALPLAKFSEVDACPTHNAASHIDHPFVAIETRDLLGLHLHHDAVGLAHHWRYLLGRDVHRLHALPTDGIER